jgi:predicted phosphodiesterase
VQLLVTADLHYNQPRSAAPADELIDQMNRAGGDVLMVVGDTAAADGDALERCLSRFKFVGEKLFVAGNHELWTYGDDSNELFRQVLPRRVRDLGWQWLQEAPFIHGDIAIVGNIGWYDYSFAQPSLGIPHRFYAAKVSPGAARRFTEFAQLFEVQDDIPAAAREIVARWNDGRFVHLHRSDEAFLDELLAELGGQLESLKPMKRILVAVHHLPFAALLPPPHSAQWDFAKAYLGSQRIGALLTQYPNVSDVVCGHSHFAAETKVGQVKAVNIGSGYRSKTFKMIQL